MLAGGAMKRLLSWFPLGILASFLLVGCLFISQYHLGYHHFGNGKMGYGVVSSSSVGGLEGFEESCAKAFACRNVESLKPLLAPKLGQALDNSLSATIDDKLKDVYETDGTYQRLQIVPRSTMLDEAAGRDAFGYYDLVNANYLLKGKTNAVVCLYMTKVDGEVRLAGFEILDHDKNPAGNNPPMKYIFPESVDKARMIGRRHKRIQ
jgi:hypothetical protein